MDESELKFILHSGEGQSIEFKESFDPKSLAKEIVAFANSSGGKIILGVNDKCVVNEIKISNQLKSQIQDLARNCDPSITINLISFENILIVEVLEGKDKPYQCSSGFFIRQGANSQKLTRDEIQDLFKREQKVLFDEIINNQFQFKRDFNKVVFDSFLRKSGLTKIISTENILKNLGVFTDNKLRNAGVLFFCKSIKKFIPWAAVTCVLYKSVDKTDIIDRKDFEGDIISNYDDAVNFLYRNLKLSYDIKGFGARKEILELPEEALKEALVNALAHRDYFSKGANVMVEIFRDRVEITNPGGLVPAIKKSEFGKKSFSRNPLLFSLFKEVHLVEKVGSGIGRIKDALKKASLPPPVFEFSDFFTITFQRRESEPLSGSVNVPVNVPVNERQKKILLLLEQIRSLRFPELKQRFSDVSEKTLKRDLAYLQKNNIIVFEGAAKTGHYRAIKRTLQN